ncbi:uncharacterized protein C18orf63-like [Maniola jurtina]|uniref:uncharacterized protein C18orf63-like n=1 Tax=Maniola jurtina TaxID=191418 RepID=UPI001E68D09F|nr:uncharacterized protein C18orf63-like [Maniola jurtina]
MQGYQYNISNSNYNNLGYLRVVANINDKHDRSAPSNYHWKVLKCRMIIFSASSLLASPDKSDVKQIHIIFNKIGNDYDRLTSLFLKYSLTQDGTIGQVTSEIYQMCFHYTMSAKIAPIWNVLGYNHLINNRDFLTAPGPQDGIQCTIVANKSTLTLQLKPVKIHLIKCKNEKYLEGESIRVLPSLNKGIIEEYYDALPQSANFKCYKDLRRHWKNIHGYRLPEEEHPYYYAVRFWRGDPLTYPAICLTRNFPIITPLPKSAERQILMKFINCLKSKMPTFLGIPLTIEANSTERNLENINHREILSETQAVSLCTPTQYQRRDNLF